MRYICSLGIIFGLLSALNCQMPTELAPSIVASYNVWIIELGTIVHLRFTSSLKDYLNPSEELIVESQNASILQADTERLVFCTDYNDGSNNGYICLTARSIRGENERVLAIVAFASTEIPYRSSRDLIIPNDKIRDFPELYDYEAEQTVGYVGFFTHGLLTNALSVHIALDNESLVPDRSRRLPRWVEAELKVPPGKPGSSIPRFALPRRPLNCLGFENGRKVVNGEWVSVGEPTRVGEPMECGSITSDRQSEFTRYLCGKAATEFAASLGVKIPLPGQSTNVGANIKIRGELNVCITVTVRNNTGTKFDIICKFYEGKQMMIKDTFCCRNGTPYLCERSVCYRTVTYSQAEISALGLIFPKVQGEPAEPTCTRTH
ncbi:MAG: hypothetical protein ACK4ME_06810 [Fimbriimonadales bacterium]